MRLLTQHSHENAQLSPDPLTRERVGSGDETIVLEGLHRLHNIVCMLSESSKGPNPGEAIPVPSPAHQEYIIGEESIKRRIYHVQYVYGELRDFRHSTRDHLGSNRE